MFFFNKKPKSRRLEDKVWFTTEVKYRSIISEIQQAIGNSEPLFILSFFSDSLERISINLNRQNLQFHTLSFSSGSIDLHSDSGSKIFLLKPEFLKQSSNIKRILQDVKAEKFRFLFIEHYPIFSKEEEIINLIDELTEHRAELCFQVSLDEPMINVFGGDRIVAMVKRLGMSENESLSNNLITKSITNAQKRIEQNVSHESTAHSQADWFRMNLKNPV